MKQRDDMTFPMAEYERRLAELRQRMEERMLDAVIITDPSNLMYLTDYQTTGYSYFQALIVPLDNEPLMITRHMEESNVHARTWVEHSLSYSDTENAIQLLVETLEKRMKLNGKHIGFERNSYFFPAYQQDRMIDTFKDHHVYDCYGIVEQGRACKSQVEIEHLQKVAKVTEAGTQAGIEACVPGVTENEIAAEVSAAMFKAGGEFPAVMPYITSGPRTMIGHATWEGRTVNPGEHVFLEVGGCIRRYHTAMMHTVVLDDLSSSMVKAQEKMIEALNEIHRNFRPGLTIADADMIVRHIITENDIGATLITRAGYSMGIAFPPSWDEGSIISIKSGDFRILREGMVFHMIPWMWGVDGDKTVGISDTIYITKDGCHSFFNMKKEFTTKPGEQTFTKPQSQEKVRPYVATENHKQSS